MHSIESTQRIAVSVRLLAALIAPSPYSSPAQAAGAAGKLEVHPAGQEIITPSRAEYSMP